MVVDKIERKRNEFLIRKNGRLAYGFLSRISFCLQLSIQFSGICVYKNHDAYNVREDRYQHYLRKVINNNKHRLHIRQE